MRRLPSSQEIEEKLKEKIQELAGDLLGDPHKPDVNPMAIWAQWLFVRHGQRALSKGQYYNFEAGKGGRPLGLIQETLGLSSFKDAPEMGPPIGWERRPGLLNIAL